MSELHTSMHTVYVRSRFSKSEAKGNFYFLKADMLQCSRDENDYYAKTPLLTS